jgi:ferritin-like metal-binding protein YciE
MGLFSSTEFNSLQDLLINQLEDLYDAEKRLTEALPKMAEAASSPQLRNAFVSHLQETREHVERLDLAFRRLGHTPGNETCQAMKGLISEGEEAIQAKGDTAVRDAALIAAAQRVEHYEIAGYGTTRTFAKRLGYTDVAQLLETTLEEEGNADKLLTQIAEQHINVQAMAQDAGVRMRTAHTS